MCYNSHSSGWRRDCRGEGGGHWRDPFRRAWWWSCDQSNPFSGKIWSNKQQAHFPPKILDQWSKAKTEEANDEVVKKIDLDKMDLVEKMSQITQVAQIIRKFEGLPQTSSFVIWQGNNAVLDRMTPYAWFRQNKLQVHRRILKVSDGFGRGEMERGGSRIITNIEWRSLQC